MPNIGGKSNGGFKPSSKNKGAARKAALSQSLGQRGMKPSRNKHGFQEDDMPLNPDIEAEDEEQEVSTPSLPKAEPFSDGIVARQFRGLVIVPRVGGEECSVLSDFLTVFSRTAPFIGSINQKASYMKKQGGRLL